MGLRWRGSVTVVFDARDDALLVVMGVAFAGDQVQVAVGYLLVPVG